MIRPAAILALLPCAALSGCGTMYNIADREIILPERPATPFGGVGNDLRWMARCDGKYWGGVPLAAADMPLSFAGDIITLPYTVPYWLIHAVEQPAASDQQPPAPGTGPRNAEPAAITLRPSSPRVASP